jgi:hypothetical protein
VCCFAFAFLCVVGIGGVLAASGGDDDDSTAVTAAPSDISWPAPTNPLQLAEKAGLTPATVESFEYHVHAHLDVFVDGKSVMVPGGIGINIDDPGVKSGTVDSQPAYGGIKGCDPPCISSLHTHDVSGIIHNESPKKEDRTLGQFFTEWDVKLTSDCVATYCRPDTRIAVYIDGKQFTGDPTTIELTNMREIAIVIGTPPAEIPKKGNFSGA